MRPHGKDAFVSRLPHGARVFDIGCGNRSPERMKLLRPDLYYVGLDVQDYEQSAHSVAFANEYRITSPGGFVTAIGAENETMDAVVSSHNLEHCQHQGDVIRNMARALKSGGRLYLSFPCEASVDFPSRRGSLRFSDDPTHTEPPGWHDVQCVLMQCGMNVTIARRRYRPLLPAALGLLLEPASAISRRVMPLGSTWALWGFETVIWAVKRG